ncbi:hypothetical protein [Bradyrhizobium sp. STM 3557]|uniref:hypothetical protein n=1 Tax=Bradyrhizobium sp. STM 3557 TaxID=578920 RepID=UPI00388CF8D2
MHLVDPAAGIVISYFPALTRSFSSRSGAASRTGEVSWAFFRHIQKYFTTEGLNLPPVTRMQADRKQFGIPDHDLKVAHCRVWRPLAPKISLLS